MKKLRKRIFSLLPDSIKENVLGIWHWVSPPKIWMREFVADGCVFEVPTKMEQYRIKSIGDEKDFFSSVLAKIHPGDVFFDIGANLGLYSIHASKLGASVFAFEPDPSYCKQLQRNIQLNKLKHKVVIVDWAVSDRQGTSTLFTDGIEGRSPSLMQDGERGSVTVRTNSIDNALQAGQLPRPTIIKMDIEGAEVIALEGMKDLLSSSQAPRYLFIEIHPQFLPRLGSSEDECKRLIRSFGYVEESSVKRQNQTHSTYRLSADRV